MDAEPNCAICSAPNHAGCLCESERMQIALDQAESRAMDKPLADIREWVLAHARHHVQLAYQRLTTIRQHAQTSYLNSLPHYDLYMRHTGAPPINPLALEMLQSQIAEAHADFRRGIDLDWRSSVLRYPEVLDYFYSLVELKFPADDDRSVIQPPFAASNNADRGYLSLAFSVDKTKTRKEMLREKRGRQKSMPMAPIRELPDPRQTSELTENESDDEGYASASTASVPNSPYIRAKGFAEESSKLDSCDVMSSGGNGSTLQEEEDAVGDEAIGLMANLDIGASSNRDTQATDTKTSEDAVECCCSSERANEIKDQIQARHTISDASARSPDVWEQIRDALPGSYKWDTDYHTVHGSTEMSQGSWTCLPLEHTGDIPLTIAGAPVVLPVDYQWPPTGGVNPPPDPRSSSLIHPKSTITMDIIRDFFSSFPGSLGFYVLLNSLIQVIVDKDFDRAWASSHLPHRFGGLKVCYIERTMEPSMMTRTRKPRRDVLKRQEEMLERMRFTPPEGWSTPSILSRKEVDATLDMSLHLNDFIEVWAGVNPRQKYSGRVGLKVSRQGEPRLLMSSHVITEAILGRSLFGLSLNRDPSRRLREEWNSQVEVLAKGSKIGIIDKTYDQSASLYPDGFSHDITVIKPVSASAVEQVVSPIPNLGWLNRESWSSLRQQATDLKILGTTETHRRSRCVKCNLPSETSIIGEGIFYNQAAATGSKLPKDQDISTWSKLVSRAVLYRVSPDFEPPTGYSGIALYADGNREDGTHGPGVVGLQSFVQRSGHPQSFNMPEGAAMEQRLKTGRIAFYGAFQVPDELRQEWEIM